MNFHRLRVLMSSELRDATTSAAGKVLVILSAFSSLLAVITARFSREIMRALVDPQISEQLEGALAPPSWRESASQYVSNLNQMMLLASIIAAAWWLTRRASVGGLGLVLSRGVGRSAVVTARWASVCALIGACALLGAALQWAATVLLIEPVPVWRVLAATAAWWLVACMLVALIALIDALRSHLLTAATAGLVGYAVLMVVSALGSRTIPTPALLMRQVTALATGQCDGCASSVAVAVAATVALGGVCLLGACLRAERRALAG